MSEFASSGHGPKDGRSDTGTCPRCLHISSPHPRPPRCISELHQTPISKMAQHILPSERTIAFAAAVVSSKPADLTVGGKSTPSIPCTRKPPSSTNIPHSRVHRPSHAPRRQRPARKRPQRSLPPPRPLSVLASRVRARQNRLPRRRRSEARRFARGGCAEIQIGSCENGWRCGRLEEEEAGCGRRALF
jgi:hypothetical protein